MTTDDVPRPGAAPVDEALQFDHAEFNASPAFLICGGCGQPIRDVYYELQGKVFCGVCRDRIVARFSGGSELVHFLRGGVFGVGAALAGAALYMAIILVTHLNIGLIAILVGYMVGAAIRKGARYRGGLEYQLLAVFLTYTAVVCWPVPLVAWVAMKQGLPIGRNLVQFIGSAYSAPLVSGAKNFIGLAIIGFALLQAWRMNPKIQLPISGPFQVSGGGHSVPGAPAHA